MDGDWAGHDAGGAGRPVISSVDGEVNRDETGDVGEGAKRYPWISGRDILNRYFKWGRILLLGHHVEYIHRGCKI